MSGRSDDNTSSSSSAMALLDSVIPFLWRVGTVVAGLVAIAAGFLYMKQDSLLYFPEIGGIPRRPRQNPRRYRSPQEHDLPFENHQITCSDGVKIHAWLVLQPLKQPKSAASPTPPTIIFFHGNAGNIGLRLPNTVQMYHNLQCHVLMVEYRGFGDSDSVAPSEAGLKLDAEAALRFIQEHPRIDASKVFLFGQSLGGAVAFHLAQYAEQTPGMNMIAGVIVENTFTSISSMVDHLMPYVAPIKGLVLRIGWNSHQIAPYLKVPILYLAGAKDQLVPHTHMLELYQSSLKSSVLARIHVVENGTHNETWMQGGRKYWDRIARFIAEVNAYHANHGYRHSESTNTVTTMEEVSLTDNASTGATTTTTTTITGGGAELDSKSSIPLMPTKILGMMTEATQKVISSATTSSSTSNKKVE